MKNFKITGGINLGDALKSGIDKYKNGKKVNQKRITMAQVNKAIGEKFPNVILVKGNGYFYIASDDEATGMKIAHLSESSIYVYSLNEQTIEGWVKDVELLLLKER